MSSATNAASQPGFDQWEAELAWSLCWASGLAFARGMSSAPGEASRLDFGQSAAGFAWWCGPGPELGLGSMSDGLWLMLAAQPMAERCSGRVSDRMQAVVQAASSPVLKSRGRRRERSWT